MASKDEGEIIASTPYSRMKLVWYIVAQFSFREVGNVKIDIVDKGKKVCITRPKAATKSFLLHDLLQAPKKIEEELIHALDEVLPLTHPISNLLSNDIWKNVADNPSESYNTFLHCEEISSIFKEVWAALTTPGERLGLVAEDGSSIFKIDQCQVYFKQIKNILELIAALFVLTVGLAPRGCTIASYRYMGEAGDSWGELPQPRSLFQLHDVCIFQNGKEKQDVLRGFDLKVQHTIYDRFASILYIFLGIVRQVEIGLRQHISPDLPAIKSLSMFIFADSLGNWGSNKITRSVENATRTHLHQALNMGDMRQVMHALYWKHFSFVMNNGSKGSTSIGDRAGMHEEGTSGRCYGKGSATAMGMNQTLSHQLVFCGRIWQAAQGLELIDSSWENPVQDAVRNLAKFGNSKVQLS